MPPLRKVPLKKFLNLPPTSSNPPEQSLDKSPQTGEFDHHRSVQRVPRSSTGPIRKSTIYICPPPPEELQATIHRVNRLYSPDCVQTVARTTVARKVPKDVTVDGGDETDTTSYLSFNEDRRNRLRSASKGSFVPSELPLGSRSQKKPETFIQASSFSSVQRTASSVVPRSAPLPDKSDSQRSHSRRAPTNKQSLIDALKLPVSEISKSSSSFYQPAVASHQSTPLPASRANKDPRPPPKLSPNPRRSGRSFMSKLSWSISKPSRDASHSSTPLSPSDEFMNPRTPPPTLLKSRRPARLPVPYVPPGLPVQASAVASYLSTPSPVFETHPNSKPRPLAQSGLPRSSGQLKGVSKLADRQRPVAPLHTGEDRPPLSRAVASPSRFAAAEERIAMPPPMKTSPRPAAPKGRNPVAPPVKNSSHSGAKNERLPTGSSTQTSSHLNARKRLLVGESAIDSPRAGTMNERLHLTPLTTAFSQPYDVSSSSSPNSDSPVSFMPAPLNIGRLVAASRRVPSPRIDLPTLEERFACFSSGSQPLEKGNHRKVSVLHKAQVTNEAYRQSVYVQVETVPKLMGSTREQRKAVTVKTARGNDKQAGNTFRELDARRVGLQRSHAVYASIRP